jgi:SAM-dependent methyltransferase
MTSGIDSPAPNKLNIRKNSVDQLRFFGPFDTIRAVNFPDTEIMDLYEGFCSHFYDILTSEDEYDILAYYTNATSVGSPILELGCGTGRVAIPLARAGFEVTGLDSSPDMLAMLEKRLEHESVEVQRRVTIHHADMTGFSLGCRFKYIILGALSICLLCEAHKRAALFQCVTSHLADDGVFSFDYLATSEEALRGQDDRIVAVPILKGSTKGITFVGRHYYKDEQVQVVNFYSEIVDRFNHTRRCLGSTVKWIVDDVLLRAELAAAGLEVTSEEQTLEIGEEHPERVILVTCKQP